MCGLFASLGYKPERSRLDIIAHRGPDGDGWREFATASGPLALGHRRLAIIDLSDRGLQPLASGDGRRHLLLNGEIYNYLELREELQSLGHSFRTATDTEVLLEALEEWGVAALDKLRGMFAFIYWDAGSQQLLAARDRYGIKPLYLTHGPEGLALASEIKQLIGLASVSGRANRARLSDFLAHGVSDHTHETMFDGITQLRGGEYLTLDCSKGGYQPVIVRWYQMPARQRADQSVRLDPAEAAEQFRALFSESMKLHLRADVRIGSCLSGGLDSSSIVGLVSQFLTDPAERGRFTTVSAVYPGTSVDESAYAQAVTDHTGFASLPITPDPKILLDHLPAIIRIQDEPFGSTSILSQWAVFHAAGRAGIKVMLDGQGADEQLAGYAWMIGLHMRDLMRQGRLARLAMTIGDRANIAGIGRREKLARMGRDGMSLLRASLPAGLRSRGRNLGASVIEGDWLRQRPEGIETVASAALGLSPPDSLSDMRHLLTHASNLPMLLHWEDRNSMMHGIEARVPFLDHKLVEFALRLHGDNLFDGALTKRVLREAMAPVLPPKVLHRRDKLGFATPESDWLRGALRPAIEEGVSEAIDRFPGLLEPKATLALAKQRLSSDGPMDFTLWRIANTGLWAKAYGVRE